MKIEFDIAVYGTLMEGERNFSKLPNEEILPIDRVLTDKPCFQMFVNPSITSKGLMTPSVSLLDNGFHLHVQIIGVTKKGRDVMDEIEDLGVNYDRVPVAIEKYPGSEIYIKRDTSLGVTDSPHRVFCPATNSLRWVAHP